MTDLIISKLFIYPIKSCKGTEVESIKIMETGFEFDRHFAVLNSNNIIITSRENPKLLYVSCQITNDNLILSYPKKESIEINLNKEDNSSFKVSLFKKTTFGKTMDVKVNQWLSNVLEEPCSLIKIDTENLREVASNKLKNKISFTDAYPIHIITSASLNELNTKLKNPITDNRYRPNILISNTKPFEEENWKRVFIGNCEFEVITPTERCSLITINSLTLEKDKQQEPLRTLAKNKRGHKKVNFGIYLIPKNSGIISKNDIIKVTK